MANQILAGAVFQAGQVIAGVDADNPPYVGPPVPTYLVVRVAEGDKTSGSYPYQDRLYLYDVYNIESDPIVVNNPNGDDANQWNNYSDGFGNPNTVITSGSQQLFVGAPLEDFGGLGNQGGVYVYDKSDLTTPVTTMTSPTPSENGYFGRSVATNDTHLFVSEQGDQTLYIYDLSDLSASPTVISDTRPAANSQWNFAAQMHVTNTHLVIGDDNYDTSSASYNHGSVSIYDLSDLSSPIHLTDQDLQGACSWMGLRISNDGSQFYVGVNASWNPDNSAIHYGQMQIRDIATGNLVSTITYPAPNGNYAAFAGYIAETDDKFILSAMLEEVGGDGQQGRVYVYDKSNLSSPSTIITSPLTGDNTDSGSDRFGASLVTDDNYLYVSDRGSAGAGSSYAIWGSPGAYVWRYDLSDLSATPYQITEPAVDRAEHIQQFGTFIHMVQFPFPVTEPSSSGSTSTTATSWVVAGSIGDDDQGSNAGTAYVYSASDLSAAPTKLLPAANSASDRFGGAVAATANTIVIGAYADDEPDYNVGSAYVFNANDLSATPTKLTSPNPTMVGEFGNAVAVTDNHVVIGAYKEHGPGASDDGKVYVYNANDLTAAPVVLSGTGSYDEFGISVAADSDIIVVGAHLDDEPNPTAPGGMATDAGAVYVYNANDLTAAPTRLVAPDPVKYEHLGESISINDNQIIVGTQSGNSAGPSTGTFFVFDRNDLSAEPTEITAFDAASNDRFGYSVASSNDKIAAGAWNESAGDGAVYVYDATDLTAAPTKLTPVSGTNGNFGWNVDIDGNYLVVGAKDGGTGGQVFVYDLSDLSGAPVELSRSNPNFSDFFGWSVALG